MGNIGSLRGNGSNSPPCRLSFALPFLEGKGRFVVRRFEFVGSQGGAITAERIGGELKLLKKGWKYWN